MGAGWRTKAAAIAGAALGLSLTALAMAYAAPAAGAPASTPHGPLGDVMAWIGKQPFVLLFLVVAAGYGLGRVQIKGIGLGATASTLIIALAISLVAAVSGVKLNIAEFASTVFFNLFMFSVGMKVGPQFVSGLRRDALQFIVIGVLIPLLAVGLMFAVRAVVTLEPGLTAGIFAGSNTATPGLGSAQAAYAGGAVRLPAGVSREAALGNLSTAFAFSYCVSMVLFIVLMKLAPALARRDVKAAGRRYEEAVRGTGDAHLPGAGGEFIGRPQPSGVRAYQVREGNIVGHRVAELRQAYPLIAIERVLRGGTVLEARDDTVIQTDDTLALHGRVPRLLAAGPRIGPEVDAPQIEDIGEETADIVVHGKQAVDRTIIDVARDVGHGLFLNAMFRDGEQIPFGAETVLLEGDVLRVTGSRWRIELAEKTLGRVVRPSIATDVVTLALALSLGGLIGMITIPIGSIRLTIGSAVGLLVVGIVLATLRTRNPALGGPFPEPARRLLEDLGLNVFIAILGLNAGMGVLHALGAGAMVPIVVGSLVVGFIPAVVAWLVGSGILKMNDALLMGAVAGGRCNSAGMRAAQEATASTAPAVSYPVTFAISNVIFTLMSYVMAMLG